MVALLIVIKRRSDDWEIEYDELEVGEQLGAGSYGAVHKATWKGTEVAVKVMVSEKITKDMEKTSRTRYAASLCCCPLLSSLTCCCGSGEGDDVVEAP
jgi:predicted Ser/Thr protein kinase